MAEKLRYSDEELQEFKAIIEEKLDKAMREFENLRAVVMNNDGNGVQDTSPTFKALEEGAGTSDKEEAACMAERQRTVSRHGSSGTISSVSAENTVVRSISRRSAATRCAHRA